MAGIDSPWARKRKLALADLLAAPWILPPADSAGRRHVEEAFLAHGFPPPIAQVSTFSMPLCHQLLASGHYVCILPREAILLARQLHIRPLNVDFAESPGPSAS